MVGHTRVLEASRAFSLRAPPNSINQTFTVARRKVAGMEVLPLLALVF
jgi:hypothetical protein